MSVSWQRIFKVVWRVNGLAIFLLAGIAVIGLLSTCSSGIFHSSRSEQNVPADLAPKEPGKPELRIGQFSRVGSTSIIRAELGAFHEGSFSLKGGRSISHNVLFIETSEGKSWWLLPNSDSSISEEHEISITQNNTEVSFGKVYLINSPEKDGVSEATLLLTDPKGLKQVVIAKGAILFDELTAFSADDARVLYHDKLGYHLALIHPRETTLIKDSVVPIAFPPRQ